MVRHRLRRHAASAFVLEGRTWQEQGGRYAMVYSHVMSGAEEGGNHGI